MTLQPGTGQPFPGKPGQPAAGQPATGQPARPANPAQPAAPVQPAKPAAQPPGAAPQITTQAGMAQQVSAQTGVAQASTQQQGMIDPRKFYNTFKGRMDRVAIYSTNKMVSMQIKKGEWEIIERMKAHIGGQCRLGVYNHLPENTVLWAVVIFDERTGTPTARDSLFFASQAARLGLPEVKRERTKVKGENYQCWMFFEKPVPAKKIRYILTALLKKLGIQKAVVLPNEDELTAGSAGEPTWLPYFGGIDKWITEGGEARVDMGVKQGYTVFLDSEGGPEKNPFGTIHRYMEDELDNVITYLNEYIPPEPAPDEGIKILDSHFRKLSEKCDAFKNMQAEIRDRRLLRDEGVGTLGIMMKYLDRPDFFHKLLSKTSEYDKGTYDRKLETFIGRAFPTCSIFKKIGYCPEDRECFESRPPYIDRFGKFEEDKNKPKEEWREPSPVLWVYQGIKERMGEESDSETAVIDIEIKSLEDYLIELQEEMAKKRADLAGRQRYFSGLDTGFTTLNTVLDGLKEDYLITVAGPPGIGKTIFCTQLADQVAQNDGVNCCYITYGETREFITAKSLARHSGVDYRRIQRAVFSDEDHQKIRQASETIKQKFGKFVFVIEGNDALGIRKIREIIDFASPRLIIIDSLQAFPFTGKHYPTNQISRTELTIQQLKTLARYQRIPVIITHTTGEKENDGSIELESLIMNMSDVYLQMMDKTAPAAQDGGQKDIAVVIRKNRSGDKNIAVKFTLQVLSQRFAEVK